MTGIEKLRDWVGTLRLSGLVWADHMADELESIAEQTKRETQPKSDPAADVSMSAYDLLPQDERDAIAWVREHGGLDAVKRHWKGYVPAAWLEEAKSRHEQRRDRLKAHAWELECKCAERRETIEELGKTIDEMRPRIMPEGMEWPRFEDGEPVRCGDEAPFGADGTMTVTGVELTGGGHFIIHGRAGGIDRPCQTGYQYGQRVKRPAPKVLDADGAEIRVGEHVWHVETGREYVVVEPSYGKTVVVRLAKYYDAEGEQYTPDQLTHRAPVLASDGRPLREGETVYHIADGKPCVVREVREGGAVIEPVDGRPCGRCRADYLTHERPDSWELLEEDVAGASCPDVYCANHHIDASDASYEWAMARDIVRRAKALAERDA